MIPFSKIILTVLFDTLTNNVSFLFLIRQLFKCVALLCIYIIAIVLLFIYIHGHWIKIEHFVLVYQF
jgi:hypothetical protein